MPEPPYGIIANHLKRGEIIPFLGAGASLSGRPLEAPADTRNARFLPTGGELSRRLADDSEFPSPDPNDRSDLAKVSSYYAESSDRTSLVSFIHEMLDRDYQLGEIHHFLAELETPLLIVTTNYDDLIERAFREKGKPYHLISYPSDRKDLAASVLWWKPGAAEPEPHPPKALPLSLTDTSIIYKMHGSVDRQSQRWESYVITEEDYVDFLARMVGQTAIPARFMLEFRRRRFLFLGYGLRDWNLRVMLKNLRAAMTGGEMTGPAEEREPSSQDLRAWAIQYHPSELEQLLWRSRNVNIYDLDIDTFVTKLRARMQP